MPRAQTYARFQTGDICLYQGKRYTITSPIWVDPFPGSFTWHIERLLEHSEQIERPRILTLEWIMKNGIIDERDDQHYQTFNVSEDELEGIDDPPTWEYVDQLRAQIVKLEAALKLRYRLSSINRKP